LFFCFFKHQRDVSQAFKPSLCFVSCYTSLADSSGETEEKLHLPIYMYNVLAVFIWAETTITDTSKKQQLAPKKKRKKKRKQKDVSYNQIFKSSVLIVQPFHDFSHQLQRLCLTQQLPANFQVAN